MHVIFLSSAYFGYVHTWAFEPDAWYDADPGEEAPTAALPLPRELPATSIWRRLAARLGRRKEES